MSWFGALKGASAAKSSEPEVSPRTAKRNKLQKERLQRALQREKLKRQLKSVQEAKEAADLAEAELLALDPDIFEPGEEVEVSEDILDDTEGDSVTTDTDNSAVIMEDFEKENGTDGDKALDKLSGLNIPFNKNDIEFWFSNVEGRLELIQVKSQWLKRMALLQLLPAEVQEEVKSLFKLSKTQAGTEIYLKIKKELMDLFGPKAEDAYDRAAGRVLTGKPSQLGKLLIDDLCKCESKLNGCCCDRIVWGMFRKQLPIVVRNHISDLPFNKDTYKSVFAKADQVFDSNRGSDPQVAATSVKPVKAPTPTTEVAAVQRSQKPKKNKGQAQNQSQKPADKDKPKPAVNEESLCRVHAKWKKEANFCAAPWACKMKNVWKEPQ